jgi:hypothetical protein
LRSAALAIDQGKVAVAEYDRLRRSLRKEAAVLASLSGDA